MSSSEDITAGPVIRDRRRIDPVTGQVRPSESAREPDQPGQATGPAPGAETAGPASAAEDAAGDAVSGGRRPGRHSAGFGGSDAATEEVLSQLAERTADLQRLQAEYANYRKRVDRDRAAVHEQAIVKTLTGLIPVLDAINQAREHGELSGGFEKVADSLLAALGRLGLVTYGEKGDPFDPKIHEALSYTDSPDVTEDTCVAIMFPGYKVGDRILRPAKVAVAAPATGPDGASNDTEWPDAEEGN